MPLPGTVATGPKRRPYFSNYSRSIVLHMAMMACPITADMSQTKQQVSKTLSPIRILKKEIQMRKQQEEKEKHLKVDHLPALLYY